LQRSGASRLLRGKTSATLAHGEHRNRMDSPTIRAMSTDDIPRVVAWMVQTPLWQRYGVQAAQAESRLAAALQIGDVLLAVDVGPDRACGFAWCLPRGAFGRSPYLRLIGVRADRMGAGVGAALLAAVEAEAARESSDLFLLVSDFNEPAQRFYRRQGYVPVGAIPGFVLPDVTELIFRKRLHDSPAP
jgi:ribosomal protein S18 acetylase RimI-like enzyme